MKARDADASARCDAQRARGGQFGAPIEFRLVAAEQHEGGNDPRDGGGEEQHAHAAAELRGLRTEQVVAGA